MNFVIRDSGIYYAAKSKNKGASPQWTSFCRISDNDIFLPADNKGFKKQHKAPTEFCFLVRMKTATREEYRTTRCICVEDELQFRLWTNALRRLAYGSKIRQDYKQAMVWLEMLRAEQEDLHEACLSPTMQNFRFGGNRDSVMVPELSDDTAALFAARFNDAWSNSDDVTLNEAPSLYDLPMETDSQGMTMVRLRN